MDFRTTLLSGFCVTFGFLLFRADPTDAILTGLYGGLFTSLLTVIGLDLYERLRFHRQLRYLNSTRWTGYNLVGGKLVKYKLEDNGEEYNSIASIEHSGENTLSISVRHRSKEGERKWVGKIELSRNFLTRGSLTYKYSDSHQIGYKDILIHSDLTCDYIYLMPADNRIYKLEHSDKGMIPTYEFGTEVFKKARG